MLTTLIKTAEMKQLCLCCHVKNGIFFTNCTVCDFYVVDFCGDAELSIW